MNLKKATHADLHTIRDLLDICKLPSDDCAEHIKHFVIAEEQGEIIGTGGIEIYGTVGLLRSIAVMPKHRKKGLAEKIYRRIETNACNANVAELYLLTESAVEYFKKFGFIARERSQAPPSIANTKQFKTHCPSSATLMFHKINKVGDEHLRDTHTQTGHL